MKMKTIIMNTLFTCLLLLLSIFVLADNGKVRGVVIDGNTGETLVGVTVLVSGTATGTATDLDGEFSIELPPGKYKLQLSYISYQPLTIDDLKVEPGEVILLDNISLSENNHHINEVVVAAEAIRTTEAALNMIKKQSANIMDGISASKINLIGDNNAVDAAKRITGVSVEEGKYVYVRGLGDRYSKTTLNGMVIPGLDPDRNSLQMDIFPTSLVDNMMISKNFSAELPADFTGGIVNIETRDFPEKKLLSISAGISYNPDMHFNSAFLTHPGGSTDFLGFDDGTRSLPHRARHPNIPTPISGASQQETTDFINSFSPVLAATRESNPVDYNISFSTGNQIDLSPGSKRNPKLGYVFSLSYRSEYKYYTDLSYGEYQRHIDPDNYELRYATLQNGEMGENNVLIGLLGGLAYKTNRSKIRLTGMLLQNGEKRAGKFSIDNNGEAVGQSGYYATSDNLEYNQRTLANVLLHGRHRTRSSGWQIDWRLSPSLSTLEDPDIRKTAFTHTSGRSSFMAGAGGNPARIWRSLNELNAMGKLDVTKQYQFRNIDAKLKIGFSHTHKERDYEILFFDMQFFGSQQWPEASPEKVLIPENIYPNRPNSIYYQSGNLDPNPNAYNSVSGNTGLYISNEFTPIRNIKTVLGLRAENYTQWHTGRDQRYASGDIENGRNLSEEKVLDAFDLFPSVNVIYSLTHDQNLRISYSKSIARPSFKELSFAQILDPVSNRIFNGSLFTYPGWNGQLTETRIDNLDLRWELFMEGGQIISASAFYKNFDNPIELVRIPEQQTSTEYQPRNVGNGRLYGVEIEINKNLDIITPVLKNFNLNGNFTYIESKIKMTEDEYNSRSTYKKTGETIHDYRKMAGQSNYVINAAFLYNNRNAGLDAGFFYNVKSPTLTIVGAGLFPDVYNMPFHSLNFSMNKKIGKNGNTAIEFKVSNILDSKLTSSYQSYEAENKTYSNMSPGRSFGMGISYNF